jgi:glycosyltransferase involved in cell wall biosynthesis
MTMKIFAWCDSPLAPTGFGKSANHVLFALHEAGWDLVQLAVNQDPVLVQQIPWKVYMPLDRAGDPYGLMVLPEILRTERPDMMWTTFDPEVPWKYPVPGVTNPAGQPMNAIDLILSLREANPGFRTMGWMTVDGGPLSEFELAMLGLGPHLDHAVTMSPHVRELVAWTLQLKNQRPNRDAIAERLHVIPGGVDTEKHCVPTREEKAAARHRLGIPQDVFVILQLERNQQRKQNYLGLEVMEILLKRAPGQRGKVLLYQHMISNEDTAGCRLGFDLPNLAWRYGLKAGEDVRWPADFMPVDMMPLVYQASDVFLSTSAGEGFQYPAWEALSCGLPLVMPNDTSRAAWLKDVPNVMLYDCADRRVVMKGSYGRRMSDPDPGSAAGKILRLMKKGPKRGAAIAGHDFVARTAGIEQVQSAWLKVVADQAAALEANRREMDIVIDVDPTTLTVVMEGTTSLSDIVCAAPAVDALRRQADAKSCDLHLRVAPAHLPLVKILGCADAYETRPNPGGGELSIDALYKDGPRNGWGDPAQHRTEVIARHLDVEPDELNPAIAQIPPTVADAVRSRFMDAFGIDPTLCVGISLESVSPHRALPKLYAKILAEGVKGMGLTPVLLGRTALNVTNVGVIDLTGKTDLIYLVGLIEQLSAIVTTDSAILHFAGMVGTPMVACFTIRAPETQLRYYAQPAKSITAIGPVDGEEFPAGPNTKAAPGAWAATIKPEQILAALRELVGAEGSGPKILVPGGVHESLDD